MSYCEPRKKSIRIETIKLYSEPSRRANMQLRKPDAFLICHVIIIAFLAAFYILSQRSFAALDSDTVFQEKVRQKQRLLALASDLKSMQQMQKNNHNSARTPAAIRSGEAQEAQALQKQASIFYAEAEKSCYEFNRELSCLETIEKIVTHFPESVWAGKSLLILGDFYYRTQQYEKAHDIVAILKTEFKNQLEVQKKLPLLERVLK